MNHKINTNYLKLPDSYVCVESNDHKPRERIQALGRSHTGLFSGREVAVTLHKAH